MLTHSLAPTVHLLALIVHVLALEVHVLAPVVHVDVDGCHSLSLVRILTMIDLSAPLKVAHKRSTPPFDLKDEQCYNKLPVGNNCTVDSLFD